MKCESCDIELEFDESCPECGCVTDRTLYLRNTDGSFANSVRWASPLKS